MAFPNINNPFVIGHYVGDEYFCDRIDETQFLIKQVENGRNVALISPRRMGKSDLIHHLFSQPEIASRYHTIFIDIYATTSLEEMIYLFGKSIFEELKSQRRSLIDRFFQIIKSLRIGFKLDVKSGDPSLQLSLGDIQEPETTLREIFEYLGQADRPCLVAVDEFQQISTYSRTNTESLLRTYIQQCPNATFIFAGSKHDMMSNMFHSPAKPFYQSAVTMGLEPIPLPEYQRFVLRQFGKGGKQIVPDVISTVYADYEGSTWFLQIMMNELYALTPVGGTCTAHSLTTARQNIIFAQQISYRELLSNLSQKQKQVLQAIAKEGVATGITSAAFIQKHSLPSASSVQSAVRTLLERDILTVNDNRYRIYNYFFSDWLRLTY